MLSTRFLTQEQYASVISTFCKIQHDHIICFVRDTCTKNLTRPTPLVTNLRASAAFKMAAPVVRICRRCICSQPKNTHVKRANPNIDRIVRVDHAGELGAGRIYAGQMAILGRTSVGPTIQHMWDQEKEHLKKFEQIVTERRVRPTVLVPLWNIAGYVLGAGTALLGKEAAMACTVAVEEVISEHYDNQLRELLSSEGVTDENKELLDTIKKFRDEELEHLHIGEENDAEQAPMYQALSTVIQTGCKAAIWLSERI